MAYVALTKPRIIELLLVTTVPTMIVAEQGMPSLWLIVGTVLGGTLAAGGANAINMYVDRDIDRLMERTKNRPLVTGAITPAGRPHLRHRASRSSPSSGSGRSVNLLSAVLAVAACLFYVFVYTLWLKRTSSSNIVIGGAAGAVPVLIGWSLGHRHPRLGAGRAVRRHLLLDPAALLGPGHQLPRRLRRGRRADAPVGGEPADHGDADPRLHAAALGASPSCSRPVADMGALYLGRRRRPRRRLHLVRRAAPAATPSTERGDEASFTYSITYITLLFGAMAARPAASATCDERHPARPRSRSAAFRGRRATV